MSEWWQALTGTHQSFYCAAVFFSVFFVWQMIAALMGLDDSHGGGSDSFDGSVDHTYDNFEHGAQTDATETLSAFKLLSVRSLITFATLFSWGTALYMSNGLALTRAMGISTIWGLGGMGSVALILYMLPKLAHTGTSNIRSCVGSQGTVYLDIPEGGIGEIRVIVSDVVAHVKARSAGGAALKAGAPVRVTKILDVTLVEVEPV